MHAITSPFSSPAANFSKMYRKVDVETGVSCADPHRLIAMLFDGLMESLAQALGALRRGEIEQKGAAISRAMRIIDEGLRAGLNLSESSGLAADLLKLYEHALLRLTQANLRNDAAAIEECQSLFEPLREAWHAIGSRVSHANDR